MVVERDEHGIDERIHFAGLRLGLAGAIALGARNHGFKLRVAGSMRLAHFAGTTAVRAIDLDGVVHRITAGRKKAATMTTVRTVKKV